MSETARFVEERLAGPLRELEAVRRPAAEELARIERSTKITAWNVVGAATLEAGIFGFVLSALRARLKGEVMAPRLAHVAPDARYHPDDHIAQRDFTDSRLFQIHAGRFEARLSSFTGDDLVTGIHGDVDIRFSELYVEREVERSQDKWHADSVFKGLFFVADFHKNFQGLTVVRPRRLGLMEGLRSQFDRSSRRRLSARRAFVEQMTASVWEPRSEEHGPLQEVGLEDAEFMRHFVVHSSDQVEARYILSPGLMRRLLEFRRGAVRGREDFARRYVERPKLVTWGHEMESGRFYISFANSNVYLAKHHSRDLFEITPGRPLDDPRRIEQYARDLHLALDVVVDLNLNTRVWSKAPAR